METLLTSVRAEMDLKRFQQFAQLAFPWIPGFY